MRFHLTHILCMLVSAEALTISTIEKRSSNEESRDLAGELAAPLEARTDIEVIAGMVSQGLTMTLAIESLANYFATHIKSQSDINSCNVISGSVDGAVWQYAVTTSGKNCDTTAETKTIVAAVERELKWMQQNKYNAACFKMDHGGTWEGHLKISFNGQPIASDGKCNSVKYISL